MNYLQAEHLKNKRTFAKKLITRPPTLFTHSIDSPLSIKPRISILPIFPVELAQSHTALTESNSPDETRAEAISMRGMLSSHSTSLVILSFSDVENDTPEVCSPSRNVVSNISICISSWNFSIHHLPGTLPFLYFADVAP